MKKRFLKNVAWLQAANVTSLLFAFLIQYGYFLQDDVLGKKFFAFFLGIFVIFEAFRLLLNWEPGDILINKIAAEREDLQQSYALARQGLYFSVSFAILCSLCLFFSADIVVDLFFRKWLHHNNNAVRDILVNTVTWASLIPLIHTFHLWAVNILQAKEQMKASSPLLIAINLSRPLGALCGLEYARRYVQLQNPIDYFPYMIKGVLVVYSLSFIFSAILVKKHYPGLLLSFLKSGWSMPDKKMTKEIFQLCSSKKIMELYTRFPMWLSVVYLTPETFTLMTLSLKLFEYSKIPFAPISKTLLPQYSRLYREKRYKHLKSQVKQVNLWGLVSALIICVMGSISCLYILLPEFILLNHQDISLITHNAYPLLPCLFFVGLSISNGILLIIFDMTKLFLKLSLIQIPLCALASYFLISHYGFLGVCLYTLFYHAITNLASKYFAEKKLCELQKVT